MNIKMDHNDHDGQANEKPYYNENNDAGAQNEHVKFVV